MSWSHVVFWAVALAVALQRWSGVRYSFARANNENELGAALIYDALTAWAYAYVLLAAYHQLFR